MIKERMLKIANEAAAAIIGRIADTDYTEYTASIKRWSNTEFVCVSVSRKDDGQYKAVLNIVYRVSEGTEAVSLDHINLPSPERMNDGVGIARRFIDTCGAETLIGMMAKQVYFIESQE